MIGHISQRSTFTRLSHEGTYVRSGALWCNMLVDLDLSFPHVGYAVGHSVGGAVVRNQLRRRLRALMSIHGADLTPGWYLLGVSAEARTYDFAQLGRNVDRLVSAIQAHSVQGSSR